MRCTHHHLLEQHNTSEDALLELIADAQRSHNIAAERAAKAALALSKELAELYEDASGAFL